MYSQLFLLRRLGPSINCLQKNQEYQAYPKIFEILATHKTIPILKIDLKKDTKMHTDPQT